MAAVWHAKHRRLTCNGSPASEEDIFGHWVVWWGAELCHYYGQHEVLRHLLALQAVAELQVRHIREGGDTCHLQRHLHCSACAQAAVGYCSCDKPQKAAAWKVWYA